MFLFFSNSKSLIRYYNLSEYCRSNGKRKTTTSLQTFQLWNWNFPNGREKTCNHNHWFIIKIIIFRKVTFTWTDRCIYISKSILKVKEVNLFHNRSKEGWINRNDWIKGSSWITISSTCSINSLYKKSSWS